MSPSHRVNLMTLSPTHTHTHTHTQVYNTAAYKLWHAAQLNEAEYAGIFTACLLYFHVQGVDAGWIPLLYAIGQPLAFWPRVLIGDGNIFFPPQVAGAVCRYFGMALTVWTFYKSA